MSRAFAHVGLIFLFSVMVFGQSAERPLAFEVADVHASLPSLLPGVGGGVLRAGRYELRNATMVDLIRTAYDVQPEKVVGGPSWLETDRFDVIAKAPADATPETAKIMLKNLLADRFKLEVHNDTKPLSVFVLTVGKNGPKMKKSNEGENGCQGQQLGPPAPGVIPYAMVSCHNLTSAQIAENLRQMAGGYLDKPVVDKTNLEGTWDFDIKWTGRAQLAAAGPDGISIFDAVDKQLGLKVEAQKLDMAVIVVDKVNQKPTGNAPGVGKALTDGADAPPEFEAAVIKPSAPDSPQQGVGFRYTNGGRIDAVGSLRDYIALALQIPPNVAADLLVGLPKYASTARYDIVAKTPSTGIGAPTRVNGREIAPPIDVALTMLRRLLEDQFALKSHQEEQQATVYVLSLPKGQSKLKKAEEGERAGCKPDPGAVPITGQTTPMVAWTCVNTTMADLAKNIQQWAGGYIDHPVVDVTGLQGGWDFSLYWTPRGQLQAPARPADATAGSGGTGGVAALDPTGLTVFEAFEKELGLKLDVQKHSILVTVVDHINEQPKQ